MNQTKTNDRPTLMYNGRLIARKVGALCQYPPDLETAELAAVQNWSGKMGCWGLARCPTRESFENYEGSERLFDDLFPATGPRRMLSKGFIHAEHGFEVFEQDGKLCHRVQCYITGAEYEGYFYQGMSYKCPECSNRFKVDVDKVVE